MAATTGVPAATTDVKANKLFLVQETTRQYYQACGETPASRDILVPICQKILAKRLVSDATGARSNADIGVVFLEATVIQMVLGIFDLEQSFKYRVNGSVPAETAITQRRGVPLVEVKDDGSDARTEVLGTSFTIDIRVPLKLVDKFNAFPFRILDVTVEIELQSPALLNGTIMRPVLWTYDISTDGCPTDVLQLQHNGDNLDSIELYGLIGLNPIRQCPIETKSDNTKTVYHPRTDITWYLKGVGLKNMLPSLAPLYLVLLLVIVNYWTTVMHVQSGTEDEKNDRRRDYFSSTVGIVLAAVILLPAILNSLQLQSAFNFNDAIFLIWIFGLGLSSIPYRVPALCGIGCLGLAGASPFAVFLYFKWEENKLRKEMKKEVFVTVPGPRKKPRGGEIILDNWKPPTLP